MCEIVTDDYEFASVWVETTRVSRVAHQCRACLTAIEPRTTYVELRVVHDGTAETQRLCFDCDRITKAFGADHGVKPDGIALLSELDHCIADGDPKSFIKYAPMAAAVRERLEAAQAEVPHG